MIEQVHEHFPSMLDALDIFYCQKKLKPVSRVVVKESEKDEKKEFLESIGLHVEASSISIISDTENDKQYSNKGYIINEGVESGEYSHVTNRAKKKFLYVSAKPRLAKKAKCAEELLDHRTLGTLLGYPSCCIEFFTRNFQSQSAASNDYVIPASETTNRFTYPFENNICLRCFDVALVSHFPCNFSCKKTLFIARKNIAAIKNDNADIANIPSEQLKGLVIYSEKNGVFHLKNVKNERDFFFYEKIIKSVDNFRMSLLRKNNRIQVCSRGKIIIGEAIVAEDVCALYFI